jgi:hypothetical protein
MQRRYPVAWLELPFRRAVRSVRRPRRSLCPSVRQQGTRVRATLRPIYLILLLLACTPTEPCSCLAPPGLLVVVGSVERADSTPAIEAVSWFQTYNDTLCLERRYRSTPAPVDGSGRYLHVILTGAPARECVGIFAARTGTAGLTDSVFTARVHSYSDRAPPDTLVIPVLRLP